jgi:Leucine-rich repeat (LRR) protein
LNQKTRQPDNQLMAVPAGLSALGALRVLTLDGNRLTELPSSAEFWRGLRRLESLSVARNALAALPAALGELGALRALCAAGNKLSALPTELSKCALLEALDASRNPQLAGVPAALGRLTRLAELRLDDCAVAAVPAEVLRGCVALQTLSLHGCVYLFC